MINDWGFSVDNPKKGARILQLTSFHHFIYSKKCLGLKQNLAFNQGTRIRFGALKVWVGGRGEGIRKFVRTSAEILATPLRTVPAPPPPPREGAPPRCPTPYPLIYHFWQKLHPFRIPSMRDGTHFTYIVYNFVSLLTVMYVLPFKYEKITKPENFLDFFTTIKSFCSNFRSY